MKNKYFKTLSIIIYSLKTMAAMDKMYLALLFMSMVILSVTPFINANLVRTVINMAVEHENVKNAVIIAVVMLTALTVLNSSDIFVMWYRSNHYISIGHKFDIIVAQKTLNMKYENAENPRVSDLRMRAAKGCSSVPRVAESITDLTANIIKIAGCSAIFTLFNPLILLIVILFSIINYFLDNYFQKKCFENEKEEHKYQRKINYFLDVMLDYISGKEIRVFSASNYFTDKYRKEEENVYKLQKNTQKHIFSGRSLNIIISSVQLLILYLFASGAYFNGNVLIGDVILYINLALVFSGAFSGLFSSFISIGLQGERIKDFEDYLKIDEENKSVETVKITSSDVVIEFDHVWFKYNGSDDYVLKDITLKIESGKKIAIVGENGSGKTTLIKLLMRFYSPTKGRILINGIDYLTIEQEQYYSLFSTVFQDFNLLAFTIKENIDYSRKEHNETKIKDALERLDMLDKINSLPKGLDTYITQEFSHDGTNFSGGERQKLAIARADYKNSPVLILDEPTSALDPIAEKRLYDNIYYLMEKKTMIMISHRLQSTRICDCIFYIKNGCIEEEGSHSQLIEVNGFYRQMFDLQAGWHKDEDIPQEDSVSKS